VFWSSVAMIVRVNVMDGLSRAGGLSQSIRGCGGRIHHLSPGGRLIIVQFQMDGRSGIRDSDVRSCNRSSAELTACLPGLSFCRRYQEILPAEGVTPNRGPKIPIEQMFTDYVQTRGLSNWKFWIVSLTTSWYYVVHHFVMLLALISIVKE